MVHFIDYPVIIWLLLVLNYFDYLMIIMIIPPQLLWLFGSWKFVIIWWLFGFSVSSM